MIKKHRFDSPRLFVKNHPIVTRVLTIVTLPLAPLIVAALVVWNERKDYKDALAELVAVAFRPWEFG